MKAVFALVFAAILAFGLGGPAIAKEKKTVKEGMAACIAWCERHNKTVNSQGKCIARCGKYWGCNGADATAATCEAAKTPVRDDLPPMPAPILRFLGVEEYAIGATRFTRFKLAVINRAAFDARYFAPAPNLPPCGANTSASRSWVDIHDGGGGQKLYGFCSLGSNEALGSLWFAVEANRAAPGLAYISINDRRTGRTVVSNRVRIYRPSAPTGVGPKTNMPIDAR